MYTRIRVHGTYNYTHNKYEKYTRYNHKYHYIQSIHNTKCRYCLNKCVYITISILRIHRRHTKVHNYPQYNSVRHFRDQTNNIKTWL